MRHVDRSLFRICHFPKDAARNTYLGLFYEALKPHGFQADSGFILSPRWLYRSGSRIHALHFHWPEWLWKSPKESSARALFKLAVLLFIAKRKGIMRIWTLHNLDRDLELDLRRRWADQVGYRLMASHSDLIICHSESAASALQKKLHPKGRVVVMPHGSYVGWFPVPRPRAEVLKGLGLDPLRPVVSCLGHIKPYKGVDVACDALEKLGERVQLLVAGKPQDSNIEVDLQNRLSRIPSAFVNRRVSEQEFADYAAASDLVLLPYREITGSGALLAAWSLHRAVVASDLPYFQEVIPEGSAAGWMFESERADSLADAIQRALQIAPAEREAAAANLAQEYAWERCVQPVREAIDEWISRDR